jgi:hypothetical protein
MLQHRTVVYDHRQFTGTIDEIAAWMCNQNPMEILTVAEWRKSIIERVTWQPVQDTNISVLECLEALGSLKLL